MKTFICKIFSVGITCFSLAGCTVHPAGEQQERQAAQRDGQPFAAPATERALPILSATPGVDELIRYALLASPELEQKYWDWRSAIEQIPQDGTQATNLMLSAGIPITHGSTAFDRTTVTLANDPMADIVLPTKLLVAAQRALDTARAAGFRFQKAKYDLRQKVIDAYCDYVLAAELLKLDQAEAEILKTSATVTEAGISSGRFTQTDSIKANNDVDLLQNQMLERSARLPALQAALNAAIGRESAAHLEPSTTLPASAPIVATAEELLRFAADHNSELAAAAADTAARHDARQLADLQYRPDFSLSAGTDLAGGIQSLLGSITLPYFRHEAIDAAIAQAEANLRASLAMERAARNDVNARIFSDLAFLRGADQQLALLNATILPRARQSGDLTRSSYENGHASIVDVLESQRSILSIERLILQMNIARTRERADLDAVTKKTPAA